MAMFAVVCTNHEMTLVECSLKACILLFACTVLRLMLSYLYVVSQIIAVMYINCLDELNGGDAVETMRTSTIMNM